MYSPTDNAGQGNGSNIVRNEPKSGYPFSSRDSDRRTVHFYLLTGRMLYCNDTGRLWAIDGGIAAAIAREAKRFSLTSGYVGLNA
jgi:hypothetical protein